MLKVLCSEKALWQLAKSGLFSREVRKIPILLVIAFLMRIYSQFFAYHFYEDRYFGLQIVIIAMCFYSFILIFGAQYRILKVSLFFGAYFSLFHLILTKEREHKINVLGFHTSVSLDDYISKCQLVPNFGSEKLGYCETGWFAGRFGDFFIDTTGNIELPPPLRDENWTKQLRSLAKFKNGSKLNALSYVFSDVAEETQSTDYLDKNIYFVQYEF